MTHKIKAEHVGIVAKSLFESGRQLASRGSRTANESYLITNIGDIPTSIKYVKNLQYESVLIKRGTVEIVVRHSNGTAQFDNDVRDFVYAASLAEVLRNQDPAVTERRHTA